jgi:hypothetical protein
MLFVVFWLCGEFQIVDERRFNQALQPLSSAAS